MFSSYYIKLLICFTLITPLSLQAQTLKELLEHFASNNNLVKSATYESKSKEQAMQAQKSTYYPTLDLAGYYQRLDERSPFIPGDIYSGYVKLSLELYDGGKRSATLSQKQKEFQASKHDEEALRKSISLNIVQEYFALKNLKASLGAVLESQKSLGAQLQRVKKFYEAKVATKDDVDKFESVYNSNEYTIESLKFKIFSLKKELELKVGVAIEKLEDTHFIEPQDARCKPLDTTKALIAKKESIQNVARALESVYYPQLRVEDTYSFNKYGRTDLYHPEGQEKQNKLMLTLNIRVFDNASISKTKESVLLSSQALNEQIAYKNKEQKLQHELSLQRIKTAKSKIKSAKSALTSAKSAFETVEQKYNAGIVDNVAFLDALSVLKNAQTQYKISLYDLEVAYAIYYFYSGENLVEYLQ